MSKKYRTKSKSICGMCKPHKRGWQDKFKSKERCIRELKKDEIKNVEKKKI